MKTISKLWFETKISYEKTMDDGLTKKAIETYVVDALSFTEAEAQLMKEMSARISGAFEVENIKKASFKEVFFTEIDTDDRFYKAKLQFITRDEKTDKEKRTNHYFLVQAPSLEQAVKNVKEGMSGTMSDYEIASISDTTIIDVFLHNEILEATAKPEYEE